MCWSAAVTSARICSGVIVTVRVRGGLRRIPSKGLVATAGHRAELRLQGRR